MPADPRSWAWDCRGLTPAQRLTLFALSDQADADQGICRVSLSELAEQTELSRRGVIKALGELDGRFIDRERGGPGRRTRYRLRWEDPVEMLPAQSINAAQSNALDVILPLTVARREQPIPDPLQMSFGWTDQSQSSRLVSITPSTAAPAFGAPAGEQPAAAISEVPSALGNSVPTSGPLNALSAPEAPTARRQSVSASDALCSPPAPEVLRAPVHPVTQADESSAPTEALSNPTLVHSVLPNNSNNLSLQDPNSSLLLEKALRTRASHSAQPIPQDWTPAARVYAWAEKQGLTKDWVDTQLDEFVIYWSDAGERRKSWDATFINRLKWLNAHPTTHSHRNPSDETTQHTGLADKDYASGATPPEQIPWLRAFADA